MTSPSRALAILGLFDEAHPVWHTDEINDAMGYTRATGYRYVKDLVEFGFLRKVSAGRYALGPRIIELDYQLRRSDPLLLTAVPVMEEMVRKAVDAVLTTLFGSHLVDIYRTSVDPTLTLSYGRGRPRPLFRGAAAKVILAHLARPQLVKLHAESGDEIARCGLGADWSEFRARLTGNPSQGIYWSRGELEPSVSGAGIALFNADGEVAACLALVGLTSSLDTLGEAKLRALLEEARDDIHARLAVGPTERSR